MHNHSFLDQKTLVQEHFKQKVQISNESETHKNAPEKVGVNSGDHCLYQSLQQHFDSIQLSNQVDVPSMQMPRDSQPAQFSSVEQPQVSPLSLVENIVDKLPKGSFVPTGLSSCISY